MLPSLLLALALLPRPSFAQEAPAAPEPAAAQAPDQIVLDLALDLQQAGEEQAARDVLEWLQERSASAEVLQQAQALEASIPGHSRRSDPGSVVRFAAWEPATYALLLGPILAANEPLGGADSTYVATALLGLGAGVGSTVYMSLGPGLTPGKVNAILTGQQLGAFHGAVLFDALGGHEYGEVNTGLLVGGLLGTGAGHAWAHFEPATAGSAAVRSGMFWGTGLAAAGVTYAYGWDALGEDSPWVLLAGADLGAAAGLGLAHFLHPSREQILLFNVGGLTGAATAYVFAWTTSEVIWYAPHTVVGLVTVAGLAGGTLGVILATRLDGPRREREIPVGTALLSGTRGDVRLAVPVPTATPTEQGPRVGVQLADVRF
ncbi:MAG: hypothetical protein ABIO70_31835 [Pseudomonadota bacterium]